MRVDGFASVNRVCAHLNGQRNFTNHVTGMGADMPTPRILPWPWASGESLNSSLVTASKRPLDQSGRWQWRARTLTKGAGPS
jgi:hypothetical protein